FSAMVVDANTGRSMYAVNEDEPRHPASITKVMTLYLLFEQLDRGGLKLDSEQVTTARDLTILGRAIQERFPRYYRYFQTRSFTWAGRTIGNHNRLLGKVEGVDGIKTGFTNASGFNLMTSARLDGRHVVGVVLGGRSGASRDAIMTNLIRTNLAKATLGRTSTAFLDASEAVTLAEAADRVPEVETTAAIPTRAVAKPAEAAMPRAAVASASNAAATTTPTSSRAGQAPPLAPTASLAYASSGPGDLVPLPPSSGAKIDARLPPSAPVPPRPEPSVVAKPEPAPVRTAALAEMPRPARVTPWVIQLGASEGEDQARALLEDAKAKMGRTLSRAAPFTERIVRSGTTLYRARFSGFDDPDEAQDTCRALKRSGFACFATRS
ncbi:MAG: SPOR domain-containing protein, partial [Methylobacteriaceae bacterium]|nr:SPOR domain-containing protein [Methylobacteriaceae bacterium]